MRIEKTFVEDVSILELKGEFDTFECARFSEEIENLGTLGIKKVILNFRFLRFINSTALGAIVKAKRNVTAQGGELVISQPGQFVAKVLDQLGLSEIIPIFSEQDDALQHFKADTKQSIDVAGDNVILFHFKDRAHSKKFGRSFGVAKIKAIEETGIRFVHERGGKDDAKEYDPKVLFAPDSVLKLKFRLPFYRKAYYFECEGAIRRTEISTDEIRITAEFLNLAEDDSKSIQQFVADMRYLKDEIKSSKGTEDS